MQGNNGLMHESNDVNNPSSLTRPLFQWANTMFVVYYEQTFGKSCSQVRHSADGVPVRPACDLLAYGTRTESLGSAWPSSKHHNCNSPQAWDTGLFPRRSWGYQGRTSRHVGSPAPRAHGRWPPPCLSPPCLQPCLFPRRLRRSCARRRWRSASRVRSWGPGTEAPTCPPTTTAWSRAYRTAIGSSADGCARTGGQRGKRHEERARFPSMCARIRCFGYLI